MSEPGSRRGRTHDAEGAREALLDAAEKVFAEHGFDGARVDVIAAEAGYNKSLIFQYFGDKLGLYAAMIRRVDDQLTPGLQTQVFAALEESLESADQVAHLRALLRDYVAAYFDYLVAHPRVVRVFLWEMAEGWQTYAKIISERDRADVEQFAPLADKIRRRGLLRHEFNPFGQLIGAEFIAPCYLACIPLCRTLLPDEDFTSPEALARMRDFVAELLVNGILIEPEQAGPAQRPARKPARKKKGA